ncbi:MAG: 8-amino-7-oxononanoate synthase [Polyangia bacterium]
MTDRAAELPAAWAEHLDSRAAALRRAGLWRTVRTLASAPGPTVRLPDEGGDEGRGEGRELIALGSNNYLGLATDPRLVAAAQAAAARYGTGSGASRLLGGALSLHDELERRLAAWKGCEDCVLFSSGYLANLGAITALCGRGDTIVSDRLNHASLIDGCRLSGASVRIYPHADARACAEAVAEAGGSGGRVLIATDSVFSMDGDLAPLAELVAVAERHGALLFLDEAHATGVLGRGRGALAELGLTGRVGAVMGTCSKALGSLGGFVCGSRVLCDHLRNHARGFIFDTSLPAPVVAATLAALDVIEREPERCARARALAVRLCRSLRALGYDAALPQAAIVPVLIGESEAAVRLSARLRELGVLALAVRPPTVPAGTARLRLCTMATHTDEHIEQAVAAFAAARDSLSA